jgi:hypothetical protein
MYRRIKNEIISRVKILAKIYLEKKSETDKMMSEIESDITIKNIRNKLILSMKDSYDKKIIELSKSNHQKARELLDFLYSNLEKFKSL